MGVWKQVGQNLAGLAKHVVKTAVDQPGEIIKDALGENIEKGQATQQNSDDPNQSSPVSDLAKAGFSNPQDYAKYQQLSGNRDQMEIAVLRRKLQSEWGLDTGIDQGMAKARQEYEQKEEQRKQVEEKKEEQKKEFEFQKKQQEDVALQAAKGQASAEKQAWGAG